METYSESTVYDLIKARDKYWASSRLWRGLCIAILVIVAFKTFSGRECKPEEGENLIRLTIWSWWGFKTETFKVRFGKQKGEEENEWLVQISKK